MADTEGTEAGQDQEAAEEELDDEESALLHFSKYSEARRALPWEQWTFRERASYYMDRIFLGFLILFFLMLLGEFAYKMWYITSVKTIAEYLSTSVIFLFNWLFTQERSEEQSEL